MGPRRQPRHRVRGGFDRRAAHRRGPLAAGRGRSDRGSTPATACSTRRPASCPRSGAGSATRRSAGSGRRTRGPRRTGESAAPPSRGSAGWLSGACLMVRREAFEAVGGLRRGLLHVLRGHRPLRATGPAPAGTSSTRPSATVVHHGGHATSRHLDAMSPRRTTTVPTATSRGATRGPRGRRSAGCSRPGCGAGTSCPDGSGGSCTARSRPDTPDPTRPPLDRRLDGLSAVLLDIADVHAGWVRRSCYVAARSPARGPTRSSRLRKGPRRNVIHVAASFGCGRPLLAAARRAGACHQPGGDAGDAGRFRPGPDVVRTTLGRPHRLRLRP